MIFILIFLFTTLNVHGQDYYITTEDLNLRSGAGKKYTSIIVLEKGDTVKLLEKTSEYWVKIQGQGKIGFTAKNHLQHIEISKNTQLEDENERKKENESFALLISFLVIIITILIFKKKGEKFRYKSTAVILSFFFGILGLQKFYLGEKNKGIYSLLFCWTYIPMLIGLIDFVKLIVMNEMKFADLYNWGKLTKSKPIKQTNNRAPKIKSEQKIGFQQARYSYQAKQNHMDDIIDVNSESLNLSIEDHKNKASLDKEVPYWRHTYIYSYYDIQDATREQKEYYLYFKNKVLNGEYVDLYGNTNYAFILYFDFFNDYINHRDIQLLKKLLGLLGEISPETEAQSLATIRKLLEVEVDTFFVDKQKDLEEPESIYGFRNYYADYDPNSHKLGAKYGSKLELTEEDVDRLNKFYSPPNVFTSIEGCCIAIIHVYLATFKELDAQLQEKKSDIDSELEKIFDKVAKLEKLKFNGYYEEYDKEDALEAFKENFFVTFFKTIENFVREKYDNKRKLLFKKYAPYLKSTSFIDKTIGNKIEAIILMKMEDLILPDLDTLIALNTKNTFRWKIEYEGLKNDFKQKEQKTFTEAILRLEETNQKNPKIKQIFFDASKFISKYDKVQTLIYYAKYIYYDLISKSVDNKQLTQKLQKLLFKTEEQINNFKRIIADLIKTRDIETALEQIPKIYISKRKKIKLDRSEIQNIEQKHKGTVELLNEYLVDEKGKVELEVKNGLKDITETAISTSSGKRTSIFISEINMEQVQEELVRMIVNNSYEIQQSVVEEYAIENGMFKNQLIDSINEVCEDYLEGEALIEEDDENYVIEESYYKEIAK